MDARNGTVSITGSVGNRKVTAQFGGGIFTVKQAKPGRAIDINLAAPAGCPAAGRGARAAARRPADNVVRAKERPRKRSHGEFRTNGRYSSAAALGTTWTTVERCTSTTTRVKDGRVRVKDKTTGRSTVVRAGQSYTARKGGRR